MLAGWHESQSKFDAGLTFDDIAAKTNLTNIYVAQIFHQQVSKGSIHTSRSPTLPALSSLLTPLVCCPGGGESGPAEARDGLQVQGRRAHPHRRPGAWAIIQHALLLTRGYGYLCEGVRASHSTRLASSEHTPTPSRRCCVLPTHPIIGLP